MSNKLSKALEFANYRTTLNIQHNNMKSRVQTLLNYSVNGGTFSITHELISFVTTLINKDYSDVVLLDVYNNPIQIQDLENFLDELLSRYFEATNEYYADYTKLKQSRKIHKLIDIEDV